MSRKRLVFSVLVLAVLTVALMQFGLGHLLRAVGEDEATWRKPGLGDITVADAPSSEYVFAKPDAEALGTRDKVRVRETIETGDARLEVECRDETNEPVEGVELLLVPEVSGLTWHAIDSWLHAMRGAKANVSRWWRRYAPAVEPFEPAGGWSHPSDDAGRAVWPGIPRGSRVRYVVVSEHRVDAVDPPLSETLERLPVTALSGAIELDGPVTKKLRLVRHAGLRGRLQLPFELEDAKRTIVLCRVEHEGRGRDIKPVDERELEDGHDEFSFVPVLPGEYLVQCKASGVYQSVRRLVFAQASAEVRPQAITDLGILAPYAGRSGRVRFDIADPPRAEPIWIWAQMRPTGAKAAFGRLRNWSMTIRTRLDQPIELHGLEPGELSLSLPFIKARVKRWNLDYPWDGEYVCSVPREHSIRVRLRAGGDPLPDEVDLVLVSETGKDAQKVSRARALEGVLLRATRGKVYVYAHQGDGAVVGYADTTIREADFDATVANGLTLDSWQRGVDVHGRFAKKPMFSKTQITVDACRKAYPFRVPIDPRTFAFRLRGVPRNTRLFDIHTERTFDVGATDAQWDVGPPLPPGRR